jgi:hypothetical protein
MSANIYLVALNKMEFLLMCNVAQLIKDIGNYNIKMFTTDTCISNNIKYSKIIDDIIILNGLSFKLNFVSEFRLIYKLKGKIRSNIGTDFGLLFMASDRQILQMLVLNCLKKHTKGKNKYIQVQPYFDKNHIGMRLSLLKTIFINIYSVFLAKKIFKVFSSKGLQSYYAFDSVRVSDYKVYINDNCMDDNAKDETIIRLTNPVFKSHSLLYTNIPKLKKKSIVILLDNAFSESEHKIIYMRLVHKIISYIYSFENNFNVYIKDHPGGNIAKEFDIPHPIVLLDKFTSAEELILYNVDNIVAVLTTGSYAAVNLSSAGINVIDFINLLSIDSTMKNRLQAHLGLSNSLKMADGYDSIHDCIFNKVESSHKKKTENDWNLFLKMLLKTP